MGKYPGYFNMKGIIIVNPFGFPSEGVHQAERMKDEFDKLNIKTEIISNGFSRYYADENGIQSDFKNVDFAVFFDKDKYLSKALEKFGIKVFNSHDAIRVCDDKGDTYMALCNNGIKIPKTIFAPLCYKNEFELNFDYAKKIGKELGFPLIVKESYGSLGNGVHKVDNEAELYKKMLELKLKPHLYQEYFGKQKGTDVRIIVIGGKAVASMKRHNENDFRSNLARGGKGEVFDSPKSFLSIAEKCARVLGLTYCGVDLLFGNDNEPIVCEVNSNAFFSGIESVTGVNVAELYAKEIIKQL